MFPFLDRDLPLSAFGCRDRRAGLAAEVDEVLVGSSAFAANVQRLPLGISGRRKVTVSADSVSLGEACFCREDEVHDVASSHFGCELGGGEVLKLLESELLPGLSGVAILPVLYAGRFAGSVSDALPLRESAVEPPVAKFALPFTGSFVFAFLAPVGKDESVFRILPQVNGVIVMFVDFVEVMVFPAVPTPSKAGGPLYSARGTDVAVPFFNSPPRPVHVRGPYAVIRSRGEALASDFAVFRLRVSDNNGSTLDFGASGRGIRRSAACGASPVLGKCFDGLIRRRAV